jgi:hypothetical protein
MSSRRLILMVGATVGCAVFAVGGVLLGRALRGEEAADATAPRAATVASTDDGVIEPTDGAAVTVADLRGEPDQLLPVLAPVHIGGDEELGDALLRSVDAPAGTPQVETAGPDAGMRIDGAVPVYDRAATEPPPATTDEDASTTTLADTTTTTVAAADEATDGAAAAPEGGAPRPPWTFILERDSGWITRLGPIRIDPCAGATPGGATPEGCPEGVAATFGGTITTPPAPFAFFGNGYYTTAAIPDTQTCAADTPPAPAGQAEMTLFTRTPIAEVQLRYRPYGSDALWTDLPAVASPEAHTTWWQEQHRTRDYAIDWATLPICFTTPRDATIAYEIEAAGTDVFGQAVRSNGVGIVSPETRVVRPPTTAQITGLQSLATVKAYADEDGVVRFRSRTVPEDEADPACTGAAPIDEDEVSVVPGSLPVPATIYDPAFTRMHVARVPIPPGGRVVVCADVYPDDNPLTPLATDRLLLVAPTQQRPRLVLQGIRRVGSATLPSGVVLQAGSVGDTGSLDPCGLWYTIPEMPPGEPLTVEQTVYECVDVPLPLDATGRGEIPVTVFRRVGSGASSELREETVLIPIALDDCRASSCERPREWYELPIPAEGGRLCGTGFGSDGCGEDADIDGIAVLRLEYPVVEQGTERTGEVLLLDQVDRTTTSGRTGISTVDVSFEYSGDDLHPLTRVRFFANRPVQVRLTTIPFDDDGCSVSQSLDSPGAQTEFEFTFTTLCAGGAFRFEGTLTEPDGTVHVPTLGYGYAAAPLVNNPRVQLDLLGGPGLPELGYIYDFDITLDGQTPTPYWFDWTTTRRGSREACMGLAGSTARTREYAPNVILHGAELDVVVRMNITTTGNGDCSGRSSSGLGVIEMTGSFTWEQLQSGVPLVLETAADAPLRMRLTMTTDRERWTPIVRSS